MNAQTSGYLAIFKKFWKEEWFAEGFLWKWYAFDQQKGGLSCSDYTPQNKPVEILISDWYKENK